MREVIQGLIQTEGEAKHLVEAARAEGERLIADSQTQALATLARAKTDARLQAEQIIASAVAQAEEEKKQLLERAKREIEATVRVDPAIREKVVTALVQCVCGESVPSPFPANRPVEAKVTTGPN